MKSSNLGINNAPGIKIALAEIFVKNKGGGGWQMRYPNH